MKIVCISDTHGLHSKLTMPPGDVLVVAGDFCGYGTLPEISSFAYWLRQQPYRSIIVVAGNHDGPFEQQRVAALEALGLERRMFYPSDRLIYLEDDGIEIGGLLFYGSPWTPEFYDWAFNLPRGEALARKWALIPENTDVLITHGPPYGVRDYTPYGKSKAGCADLAERLQVVKPRLHVFGHLHSGYGITDHGPQAGRQQYSVNAAMCDEAYNCGGRAPIVIEL